MNRNRIFCRLRPKHAHRALNKEGKRPHFDRIPRISQPVSELGSITELSSDTWGRLLNSATLFASFFEDLEKFTSRDAKSTKGLDILRHMVKTAYAMVSEWKFREVMDVFLGSELDCLHMRTSLRNIVCKIGRYRIATGSLAAAARKSPLFRQVGIEDVGAMKFEIPPVGDIVMYNPLVSR